jgi:hypothetical protein
MVLRQDRQKENVEKLSDRNFRVFAIIAVRQYRDRHAR